MVGIANMAQERIAIVAMRKAAGSDNLCFGSCFSESITSKGAGVEVADDGKGEASVKGVATFKVVALELGSEPPAPLPGRSKGGWRLPYDTMFSSARAIAAKVVIQPRVRSEACSIGLIM